MRSVMDLPEEIGVIAPSTFLPGDSSRGPMVQYSCDVDIDRLLLTMFYLFSKICFRATYVGEEKASYI